jgi:transcriptional regulator with XRE-family HTH domain
MSIYSIFAQNLRAQCHRFGSIEHVCRGAGINRQQFNKYLAGQVLPNARTLTRICSFLGIREEQLFSGQDVGNGQTTFQGNDSEKPDIAMLSRLGLKPSPADSLPIMQGYYLCYFPLQHFDKHLVVSSLALYSRKGMMCFSRRTAFRSPSNPKTLVANGRHRGVVVGQEGGAYLIGFNRGTPAHPSLIFLDANLLSGNTLMMGLALTRGISKPLASRVVVQYCGNTIASGRRCLSRAGVISASDPSLDPEITLAFSKRANTDALQLNLPATENLLLGQVPALPTNSAFQAQEGLLV